MRIPACFRIPELKHAFGAPNCGDQVLPKKKIKIKKSSWSLNSSMRYCFKRMLFQALALKTTQHKTNGQASWSLHATNEKQLDKKKQKKNSSWSLRSSLLYC
jgi:hypothetical protein